ncbi:hypothetical protein P154DRAFT_428119, partial [Amniculicola lignicola CBS 123094]
KRFSITYFVVDISTSLRRALIKEFSAEKPLDNGEIYCKIQGYIGFREASNLFLLS